MYADLNVLRARAGRLASAWGDDTDPDEADLERWLSECSATLDLALGAQGITTPVDDPAAVEVLGGIAADGALVLAIEATWPTESGSLTPQAPRSSLLEGAQQRWQAALAGIRDGTSPVVAFLLTDPSESREPLSTSFWVEEPLYPYQGLGNDAAYPLTRPGAYRGQSY